MTTTTINDTLVQLEALHTAYNEILQQAKEQLESFDVSDDQIKRVADKLENSVTVQNAAKHAAIESFVRSINENELDFWRGRQFVDKIAELVITQVKDEINDYVRGLIREEKVLDMIDRRLADRITTNNELMNAMQVQGALKILIGELNK